MNKISITFQMSASRTKAVINNVVRCWVENFLLHIVHKEKDKEVLSTYNMDCIESFKEYESKVIKPKNPLKAV